MTKPAEKSFTGVGGTNIVYDVYEPASDPVGVVLVAHGVAEHAGRYAHVAEVLTGLGLRAVVPDHRGHGRSGGKRLLVRDLSEFTADLETLRTLEVIDGAPDVPPGPQHGRLHRARLRPRPPGRPRRAGAVRARRHPRRRHQPRPDEAGQGDRQVRPRPARPEALLRLDLPRPRRRRGVRRGPAELPRRPARRRRRRDAPHDGHLPLPAALAARCPCWCSAAPPTRSSTPRAPAWSTGWPAPATRR